MASGCHISAEQYLLLKYVWKDFNFNTFRDFHNHYLKKDVLLLGDTFEKFISTSLKNYNLDPYHYSRVPGLSWNAMLKVTKVELEKISNPHMHLFIKKGVTRGISYIDKKYSKANNKYCKDYDEKNPENYIVYLDMNNLYWHEMCQYLPYGRFKWIKSTKETVN